MDMETILDVVVFGITGGFIGAAIFLSILKHYLATKYCSRQDVVDYYAIKKSVSVHTAQLLILKDDVKDLKELVNKKPGEKNE